MPQPELRRRSERLRPDTDLGDGTVRLQHAVQAYTTAVTDLLADRAQGLLRALREADPDYVLLDGILAECDRVGDIRADHSRKHRRHGVNVQVFFATWVSRETGGLQCRQFVTFTQMGTGCMVSALPG